VARFGKYVAGISLLDKSLSPKVKQFCVLPIFPIQSNPKITESRQMKFFSLRQIIYALLLGIVTLFGNTLQAQTNYGSIRGRVTDTQDGALSNAEVLLINSGTRLS
jgi:hypothetical protein